MLTSLGEQSPRYLAEITSNRSVRATEAFPCPFVAYTETS
jgi:hypothetical protein